jgi:hypothetical protein
MEQHFSIVEFVIFIIGLLYQFIICYSFDDKIIPKQFIIICLTRFLTVLLTLIIWRFWFFKFDMMLGPILLPAFISECLLSPLILKLFGYKPLLSSNK